MSKKLLTIFVSSVLMLSLVSGQTNTLETRLSSIFSGFGNFGYNNQNISIKEISSQEVVIESPVILDENGNDVKEYMITYGRYPLSELLNGGSNISAADFSFKTFRFDNFNGNTFTMKLNISEDNLDPDQLYYATATPIDRDGNSGEISGPDICFRLSDQRIGQGTECTTNQLRTLQSAGANMTLANVRHTRDGNSITLHRVSVSGAPRVEIYFVDNNTQDATRLAVRNMSDQTYTFTLSSNPPQIVKLVPVDANGNKQGTEVHYTMNETLTATSPTTPSTPRPPSIGTVPVVGPEKHIGYILLITLILFAGFKISKSYQKN